MKLKYVTIEAAKKINALSYNTSNAFYKILDAYNGELFSIEKVSILIEPYLKQNIAILDELIFNDLIIKRYDSDKYNINLLYFK